MKHNIDTIKRSFNVNQDFALAEVEGFEKQIREMLHNLNMLDSKFTVMSLSDFQRLLKEILGE